MSNGKTGPKAIEAALERFLESREAVERLLEQRERGRAEGAVPASLGEVLAFAQEEERRDLYALRAVVQESVIRRSRCGRRRKVAEAPEVPEVDAGAAEDLEAPEALSACPHGRRAGECGDCDVEGDRAFDAAREDRLA